MTKTLNGIVHGKTIELLDDLGMPEGETVRVVVCSTSPTSRRGEGFLRAAGVLADSWSEEDDRILEEIQCERSVIHPFMPDHITPRLRLTEILDQAQQARNCGAGRSRDEIDDSLTTLTDQD